MNSFHYPQPLNESLVQHIRLSCQACQRKKIKCDRTFPCGQCQRSNLQCVPSQRKPRARQTGKRAADSELRSRIATLENLVESLGGEETSTPHGVTGQSRKPDWSPVGKYIGSTFWMSLTSEVQALREAFEEDDDSDDETDVLSPNETAPSEPNSEVLFDFLMCPPGAIFIMPGTFTEPPPQVASQLYDLFLSNVDPVFKVFHRPTLVAFLRDNKPYLGLHPESPVMKAVRTTVWFCAVATIHDPESLQRFQVPRDSLLKQYKRHAEVAFAQADVVNTNEIALLQALVMYNVASRSSDPSRRSWTMVSVVVRIARALKIHCEMPADSPFIRELKRRLWNQIRVLDVHAAADRASEVLIIPGSFSSELPSNVNDSEFNEDSTFVPNHETGITDMTFNLMTHSAAILTMRFLMSETGPRGDTWEHRLRAALDFGNKIKEKYIQYCDDSNTFHRFIAANGNAMAAAVVLRAVRPVQRHVSSTPPRVDDPFILKIAVNCIRDNEATTQDPEAERWRWIFWVQWHALAVALAGLCTIRDTELANTAWSYVDKAYERHSRMVADSSRGMLWRPVEKLYKKAMAYRNGEPTPVASSTSPQSAISGLDHEAYAPFAMGQAMPATTGYQLQPPVLGGQPMQVGQQMPMQDAAGANQVPAFYGDAWEEAPALSNGDMTWMDWERIMEDMTTNGPDVTGLPPVTAGDLQQVTPSYHEQWLGN